MAVILKKPAPTETVKKPKIIIAIPAYTGEVHMLTMRSLMADVAQLSFKGIHAYLIDEIGNGLIADVRSKFVARFLEDKDATHLVMIDSDVCWLPGSLPRLIEHNEEFVCGLYPRRSDPISFHFRSALEDGKGLDVTDKGLLDGVWGVPFGFVCLSRACCEKMVDAYENLAFHAERGRDPEGNDVPGMKAWALFDPYFVDNPDGSRTKLGEDYAFCARWRDIGGKLYVDPSISMGHIGLKTFQGQLGEFFESAPEDEQPAEAAE